MSADWEEGKPPSMLEIDGFVLGHVRRGWREGGYFVFTDCTLPEQNVSVPLEHLTHWRARNPVVVIRRPPSNYFEMQSASQFWSHLTTMNPLGSHIASSHFRF